MKLPKIKVKVTICKGDEVLVTNSDEMVEIVRSIFNSDTIEWTEEMVMICLNRRMQVIGYYKISSGGFAGTVCDPKVVLTIALQCASSYIVLAHNHPSGNLKPSTQDVDMTTKLSNACKLLDIKLLDHIIITSQGSYSFADNGNL